MKTTRTVHWAIVCAAALTMAATFRAAADQASATARPERNYRGTIVSVNPKEQTLKTKGFIFSKQFNLGDACAYVLPGKTSATAADLQPGEKVVVRYQDADGVLVADRVQVEPMRYEGMVKSIDPATRTLTLHLTGRDETFRIADDCSVVLRDDKAGALGDIQTGDHVTVTYEKPGGRLVARRIAQTSLEFTGSLTAIDLDAKTVKAKSSFSSKKFNVGDHCAIVINGQPDGRLSDLKPDERLNFSYDEINGVNVVNRIAPAEGRPEESVAANSETMAGN